MIEAHRKAIIVTSILGVIIGAGVLAHNIYKKKSDILTPSKVQEITEEEII